MLIKLTYITVKIFGISSALKNYKNYKNSKKISNNSILEKILKENAVDKNKSHENNSLKMLTDIINNPAIKDAVLNATTGVNNSKLKNATLIKKWMDNPKFKKMTSNNPNLKNIASMDNQKIKKMMMSAKNNKKLKNSPYSNLLKNPNLVDLISLVSGTK